jgi:hypothetical protein
VRKGERLRVLSSYCYHFSLQCECGLAQPVQVRPGQQVNPSMCNERFVRNGRFGRLCKILIGHAEIEKKSMARIVDHLVVPWPASSGSPTPCFRSWSEPR